MRLAAVAPLLAVPLFAPTWGCGDPPATKSDSGDTAVTTSEDCPTVYEGPTSIDTVRVQCDATNHIRYSATTTGWTHDGWVFAQETGNADEPYDQWSDTHSIVSYDWDACAATDALERVLEDVSYLADPLADWRTDESTVFSCDNHIGNAVMSYAFAVLDRSDNLADCLAFGDDVTGMVNGVYNRANEPDFSLAGCREGAGTEAR